MKTNQPKIIIWLTNMVADKETEHKIALINRYNQMLQRHIKLGHYTHKYIILKK